MGVKTHINAEDRMYLPTIELYETTGKFGSIVPAFNNNYDVYPCKTKMKTGVSLFSVICIAH